MNRLIVTTAFMLAIYSLCIFLPVASYAFGHHNGNYRSFGHHGKHFGHHGKHYGSGNLRHYDYKYGQHKRRHHNYDSFQFRHHNSRRYGSSHHKNYGNYKRHYNPCY